MRDNGCSRLWGCSGFSFQACRVHGLLVFRGAEDVGQEFQQHGLFRLAQ